MRVIGVPEVWGWVWGPRLCVWAFGRFKGQGFRVAGRVASSKGKKAFATLVQILVLSRSKNPHKVSRFFQVEKSFSVHSLSRKLKEAFKKYVFLS